VLPRIRWTDKDLLCLVKYVNLSIRLFSEVCRHPSNQELNRSPAIDNRHQETCKKFIALKPDNLQIKLMTDGRFLLALGEVTVVIKGGNYGSYKR